MVLVAQAVPAQGVAEPHDGIGPTCKWLIGVLGGVIALMAQHIVRQHLAERAILREWIKSMQDSKSLLDLVGEVNKSKPTGGP